MEEATSPLPSSSVSSAVDSRITLAEALELLHRAPGEAMPVIRADTGEVLGVLSRPGAKDPALEPPRLGGMATPLGVYLHDGVHAGGAGFWGLFLTGVTLCLLALAAQTLVLAGGHLLAHLGWSLSIPFPSSPFLRAWEAQLRSGLGSALPTMAFLFVLLRLLPLSGTHAAEHQVVHCIEQGAPLEPSCVCLMPRVHPRCGTNLVAGFVLFELTFLSVFSAAQAGAWRALDAASLGLMVAVPIVLSFWRRLGGWVQQWLATRPATDRQIAGAIRAARQVLVRRQDAARQNLVVRFRPIRRLWRMGLVQLLLGYSAVLSLLLLVAHFWPALGDVVGM